MQTEKCSVDIPKKGRADFSSNLNKSLQSIAQREGFVEKQIYKRQISSNGSNYLGDLYEVDIKGKTDEGKKEVNLFVKKSIDNATENINAEGITVSDIYGIEVFAYNNLSTVLNDLQEEAEIPKDFRFKMVKSYRESSNEAIILENLSKKGYKTGYRMDLVSYKFAKKAIEELAKFHGLSFALERLRPSYFEKKIKTLEYPLSMLDRSEVFLDNNISAIEDIEIKKKIIEFQPQVMPKLKEFFTFKHDSVRTMAHGDYRANNILCKENGGEVVDIIPVDYQILHYGCPVNDFLYFIHWGTDLQFRKKYLEELKDIYYETMKVFLQYFDIDVGDVFPRECFEKALKYRRAYGLMVTLVFSGFVYADDQSILDFGSISIDDWKPSFVPYYQTRIKEVYDEYFGTE